MKLSIIIPIYNVEQYLRKCVDSVLQQDLQSSDYEIILVDDGSPDECSAICDEYAHKSQESRDKSREMPLIQVVHRENGGLSAARNSGIEVARGEYVMFVDSDDYIESNVLGGLMEQVERDNLDVLRYRLQYVRIKNERVKGIIVRDKSRKELMNEWEYEVYCPYKSDPFKGNDYSDIPTDGVSFLNSRMNTQCYAWQFILRRDLITGENISNSLTPSLSNSLHGVLFTPGIYFEDTDWTPRMLCRANRVASTDTIVYNYLVREGSITNAVSRSKQKKVLDDKIHLIATLQKQAVTLRKSGRYNRWYSAMIADTVVSIIGMLSTNFYNEKESYLEQLKSMDIFPILNKSVKTRLINLSPRLAVELLHMKNGK